VELVEGPRQHLRRHPAPGICALHLPALRQPVSSNVRAALHAIDLLPLPPNPARLASLFARLLSDDQANGPPPSFAACRASASAQNRSAWPPSPRSAANRTFPAAVISFRIFRMSEIRASSS